jgi:hypothetical protein
MKVRGSLTEQRDRLGPEFMEKFALRTLYRGGRRVGPFIVKTRLPDNLFTDAHGR